MPPALWNQRAQSRSVSSMPAALAMLEPDFISASHSGRFVLAKVFSVWVMNSILWRPMAKSRSGRGTISWSAVAWVVAPWNCAALRSEMR
jgi:hypothetical protein